MESASSVVTEFPCPLQLLLSQGTMSSLLQVLYPLRPCMRIALTEVELQSILSSAQEAMCDAARETMKRNEQRQEEELQDFLLRTGKL